VGPGRSAQRQVTDGAQAAGRAPLRSFVGV
jgi:hypothetical protein